MPGLARAESRAQLWLRSSVDPSPVNGVKGDSPEEKVVLFPEDAGQQTPPRPTTIVKTSNELSWHFSHCISWTRVLEPKRVVTG